MLKWKAYWVTLIAALLGLLWFKNRKFYSDKPASWQWSKSLIECFGIVMSAIYLPALLIAYASIWITKPIKHEYLRTGISIAIGVGLTLMGSFFLEALVVISVFAVELLSGDFLRFLQERRDRRNLGGIPSAS